MKTAAFFDIDGTLYRNALMIEHFKKLLKYEIVDEAIWHTDLKHKYENWQKRRGHYDDYIIDLAEIYIKSLVGKHHKEMEFVTDQVIRLQADKVYMSTRQQIAWHIASGHLTFFISGSPEYLVQKMGEKYGVTESIGTKYLLKQDGTFSGDIVQMWDHASKLKALKQLVNKYAIDLAASYAYGDTYGDIAMFSSVGHPVAINPTKELLLAIKEDNTLRDKTKIIVERKDVIYHLSSEIEIIDLPDDEGKATTIFTNL